MELILSNNKRLYPTKLEKRQTVIICLSFVLIISSLLLGNKIKIFAYIDELLGLIFGTVLLIFWIKGRIHFSAEDGFISFLLVMTILIGIISNLFSNLTSNMFLIALDLLGFIKVFIAYLSLKYLFGGKAIKISIQYISGIAKIVLVLALLLGIISTFFFDIGMRGQFRFGLYGFDFVFGYAHEFEVFLIFCISSILLSSSKNKVVYLFITVALLFLTLKGPSFVIGVMLPFLYFYFSKHKKLNLFYFIIPTIIILFLSSYQINEYLFNPYSARAILIKFGFITGNHYFPLGSGFSTYGTSTAFTEYSRLYYLYGFDELYGLNPNDGSFLNDNYFPMVIAQFGYFGLCNMILIFGTMLKESLQKRSQIGKTLLVSILCFLVVHSLGSALLTSSAGFLGMMVFGMVDNNTSLKGSVCDGRKVIYN